METIFSKIINREIPANIVYEDELCLAFLDINPLSKGHTLVIPKTYACNFLDIDTETLMHLTKVSQKIAQTMQTALGAKGVNIYTNAGKLANQQVMHFHIHVIPRYTGLEFKTQRFEIEPIDFKETEHLLKESLK